MLGVKMLSSFSRRPRLARGLIAVGLAMAVASSGWAASWTNTAGGNFDAAGNWDPNVVPNANTENALLPQIGSSYTVTLTESMFPGGLSNRVLHLNGPSVASANVIALNASGTSGSPLNWTIGNPDLPGAGPGTNFLHLGRSAILTLNYVNIDIDTTNAVPANAGYYINIAGTLANNAKLSATNSQIVLDSGPPAGAGQRGLTIGQGSTLEVVDGYLKVTRTGGATETAVSADGSRLRLENTPFEFDLFNVGYNAIVWIDNGGITATSRINRAMTIQSGTVNFGGGVVQHGVVGAFNLSFVIPTSVGGGEVMNLTNTTLQLLNGGSVLMNPLGAYPVGTRKVQMNLVGTSSVIAQDLRLGGTNPPTSTIDNYQVTMSGSNPQLLLSGNLELGNRTAVNNGGAGRFVMSAGALVASNLFLGSPVGDGYYEQTGGAAVLSNSVIFQKGTTVGAQRFLVGSGATMTLMGTGMVFAGSGSFLIEAADWDTSGTLVMDPTPGIITQQLTVAGLLLGTGASAYSNNFAIGMLDLSAYGPNDRLQLLAPQSTASTALYVSAISSIATNALISAFDVYYDPGQNLELFYGAPQGIYSLTGGGFLIPLPEPGVATLLVVGLSLLLGSRRTLGL